MFIILYTIPLVQPTLQEEPCTPNLEQQVTAVPAALGGELCF